MPTIFLALRFGGNIDFSPMRRFVLCTLLFGWVAVATLAAPAPRYILLLHSFEREFKPLDFFADVLRTELSRQFMDPIRFIDISLQPGRFAEPRPDEAVLNYLRATLDGRPPMDVIVSIGGPAAQFAQKYRPQLFPDAPLILAAVDRRLVESGNLTARDTAVMGQIDPAMVVQTIQRLLPDTTTVNVVIGASPLEQLWQAELTRAFEPFSGQLRFVWFNDLSEHQILERCSALPAHSVIFYALFVQDANGASVLEDHFLAALHATANAPMFGVQSTQLGAGILGGPLLDFEQLGRKTADVALRVLRGEPPRSIQIPVQRLSVPTFDGRELQRWRIDERRLPPESVIRFQQPSLWARYKWPLVAGTIGVAEMLLILTVLVNHARRRRAEASLRESEARFRLLADAAPVMIWMSGSDHRRTDFNRPWLEFTGRSIDVERDDGWTAGVHPDDLTRCLETYSQACGARNTFRMEYRLRRFDGEYLSMMAPRYSCRRTSRLACSASRKRPSQMPSSMRGRMRSSSRCEENWTRSNSM